MSEKNRRGGERRPSRRSFLKLATSAGVTAALGVGARGHGGPELHLGEFVLELKAWRIRPGGEMEFDVKSQQSAVPRELVVRLVEVNQAGQVMAGVGVTTARRVRSVREGNLWTGHVKAPSAPRTGQERESFLVAAALTDHEGRVVLSNRVEVVCTPQCAGA